jgi:hypothetical protein
MPVMHDLNLFEHLQQQLEFQQLVSLQQLHQLEHDQQ